MLAVVLPLSRRLMAGKVLAQVAVGGPGYILLTSLVSLSLGGRRGTVSRGRTVLVPRPRPAF